MPVSTGVSGAGELTPHLAPLRRFLEAPDPELLEHNRRVAVEHLSLDALARRVERLLAEERWLP